MFQMRTGNVDRKTNETDIKLSITLDGSGKADIATGCGFLDHMLILFAHHGKFDLRVKCDGDTFVDYHHTVEDIGISLGKAIKEALGDKNGIVRYGDAVLPMDESLILSAVDISGRGGLYFEMDIPTEKVGDFDTELVEEFWRAFACDADITLHIRRIAGSNSHHIIEGSFKSVARSLRKAVAVDAAFADELPSTKGLL